MRTISPGGLAVATLLLSASGLYADSVTYLYTGNPFSQLSNGSSFTTLDSVSGSVTLDSPLPDNSGLTNYSDDVIAVSFFDGVDLITTLNPSDIIKFGTSNGQISKWNLALFTGVVGFQINTQYSSPTGMDNYDEGLSGPGDFGLNAYDPGVWASSPSPEPSSVIVFPGALLLALGMTLLRRGQLATTAN